MKCEETSETSSKRERARPRAVIYVRSATKAQADPLSDASVMGQYRACRAKARELGAIVEAEYSDIGYSGLELDRPGSRLLMKRLKQKPQVDYVIVRDVARLARSRLMQLEFPEAMKTSGAKLVSCSGSLDESPRQQLFESITALVGEYYSRSHSAAIRRGKALAKKRREAAKLPVGYRPVLELHEGQRVRRIQIDPEKASAVRDAFAQLAREASADAARAA